MFCKILGSDNSARGIEELLLLHDEEYETIAPTSSCRNWCRTVALDNCSTVYVFESVTLNIVGNSTKFALYVVKENSSTTVTLRSCRNDSFALSTV